MTVLTPGGAAKPPKRLPPGDALPKPPKPPKPPEPVLVLEKEGNVKEGAAATGAGAGAAAKLNGAAAAEVALGALNENEKLLGAGLAEG